MARASLDNKEIEERWGKAVPQAMHEEAAPNYLGRYHPRMILGSILDPVIKDGLMPTHKGPKSYTPTKNQIFSEQLFEQHFGMEWMSEAEVDLENYCAHKSNPRTIDLIWIECSCGGKFLAGDDYVCGGCRASL